MASVIDRGGDILDLDGQRPDWWCYPKQCAKGHLWAPGRITVSWV